MSFQYNVKSKLVETNMKNYNPSVGDMVKCKPLDQLHKLGVKTKDPNDIPFINDIGIVVQVLDSKSSNYVVVRWQKLNEECAHFATMLDKIGD